MLSIPKWKCKKIVAKFCVCLFCLTNFFWAPYEQAKTVGDILGFCKVIHLKSLKFACPQIQ